MKKILFVTAPYHCWGVQVIGTWPPLHLVYLAGAALDVGVDARIFDAMNKDLGFDEIRAEIVRYQPDYVMAIDYLPVTGAISTATVPDVLEILRIAKEVNPGIVTLTGGPHPTFMFREMFEGDGDKIDFILRGEAEMTLQNLLKGLSTGDTADIDGIVYQGPDKLVVNHRQPHIATLDQLNPAWHLLDWDDYKYLVEPQGRMASVLTSRGCDMSCAFCAQRMFWNKDWRSRDAERAVEEIAHLRETYQVDYVTLIDAYPTKNRARWESFLDLMIEADLGVKLLIETRAEDIARDEDILHKYSDAGIIHVYIGAESADNDVLSSLNKGLEVDQNKRALDLLREAEIMTEASFMIGFPTETWESVQRTIDSAIALNPDVAVFPVVTPMPFTPIHKQMRDRIRVHDYSKYNLVTPIVEPYDMTLDEVTEALGECYMQFYRHKGQEIADLPRGYKKRYLVSAMMLMMKAHGEDFDFAGKGMKLPPGHDILVKLAMGLL